MGIIYDLDRPPSWEDMGLEPHPAPDDATFWNNKRRRALAHCAQMALDRNNNLWRDIRAWRIAIAEVWNSTYANHPNLRITGEAVRGQKQQGGWMNEVMKQLSKRAYLGQFSFFKETNSEQPALSPKTTDRHTTIYPRSRDELIQKLDKIAQEGDIESVIVYWRLRHGS